MTEKTAGRDGMASISEELKDRLGRRKAEVATLGLGYVGLPLSVEFAAAGFKVTGFDLSPDKVDGVNRGESHIKDVPAARVKELVTAGRLRPRWRAPGTRGSPATDPPSPVPGARQRGRA